MTALIESSTQTPRRTQRTYSRWASLVVLCAGALMTILDGSIVTVAMPAIQSALGFSPAGLAWVVNAYLIPFGGLLLLIGRLGDLLGRKRMFTAGLAVFTVASVLCGTANSQGLLIAARAVQGVGGAMASAVVLGMLVALFPEPREQARAIAVFSAVGSVGATLGTFLGGALTEALSWHWIFLINLPIGVVAWLAALRVLAPERGAGLGNGADYPGAALVTAALMLTVYVIVGSGDRGPTATLLLAALALALFAGFAVRQMRTTDPLLRPRLFRSRLLTGANTVQILMIATMYGFQFIGALYIQRVLGFGELATGFAFLPAPVAIGILMMCLSVRATGRFGAYRVLLAGLVLITVGMALLSRAPVHGSYVTDVLPPMLLLAAGFAAAMPPLTGLAMSGAREEDAGLASGLFNTTQVVGGSLGLATLSTLAASHTAGLLGRDAQLVPATAQGYQLAFRTAALVAAGALVLAAAVLRPRTEPVRD
ncbi:MFS transporter [Streptomyces sp. TLI_185]|uniref:MFS transporter n=1 Tax=Streptomyces sp. TLI_185 TaxID=2485151 RepID=UPI000F4E5378|nr:MFS transporter [Streptomyces sp. TLI_185]RPF37307.1 EmrB/QacA subfamily drug resistance transporter [Streptomyces sp. TLI_185]